MIRRSMCQTALDAVLDVSADSDDAREQTPKRGMNQTWMLEAQVWNAGWRHIGYLDLLFPTRREARRWTRSRKSRIHDGIRLITRPYDGEVLLVREPFIGTANRWAEKMSVDVDDGCHEPCVEACILEYQIHVHDLGWYHMGYGPELLHTKSEIEDAQARAAEAIRIAYKRKIDSIGMMWNEARWMDLAPAHRCVPRKYKNEARDIVNRHDMESMKKAYEGTIKSYMAYLCGVDISTMRLIDACQRGDRESVETVLNSGDRVDQMALFVACYHGRARIVRLLLGHQKWNKQILLTALNCGRGHPNVLDLVGRHL